MMKRSTISSRTRRVLRMRPLILALCGAGCVSASLAQSQVEMPVLSGQATSPVAGVGTVTFGGTAANPTQNYNQTSNVAVWHFNSFSIGAGGTVNNTAAKASDLTVFRVMGFDQSRIAGTFNANNRMYLINRNGIHAQRGASFGGGGTFVLSGNDIDPELAADNYAALQNDPSFIRFVSQGDFGGYGGYGNYGEVLIDPGVTMVAGDGGSIFLVGDRVRNEGALQSNGAGSVGLVAAGTVELELGDSGFIKLVANDRLSSQVSRGDGRTAVNTGTIQAQGDGGVFLVGDQVHNQGAVRVNGKGNVALVAAGTVELEVEGGGTVKNLSYDKLPSEDIEISVGRVALNSGDIEVQNGQVKLAQVNHHETGNFGEVSPLPNIVANSEYSPNGVYNTGTIVAKGADGAAGSVTLEAKGSGNVAVNAGTIDVSTTNAAARGGAITMSAGTVLHGGDGDAVARLLADGVAGGGSISLNNGAVPQQGGETFNRVYANSASEISARGTGARANGGQITLSTAADGLSLVDQGLVMAHGAVLASGGAGGRGGTFTTAAQVVNVSQGEQAARIELGAGGLWKLISTNVTIGSNFFAGEGFPSSTYVLDGDIEAVLNTGADVSLQAQHRSSEFRLEEGTLKVLADSKINVSGAGDKTLTLASTNDLVVEQQVSMTASGGRLNVTLNADSDKTAIDKDGVGSLIIGAPVATPQVEQVLLSQPAPVLSDRAVPVAVVGDENAVVIDTNGGNLVLSGAGQPPANVSEGGQTNAAGVSITTALLNAGQGTVTITGSGGATSGDVESKNGVSIVNADITGANVSITGDSTSATGVSLSNTTINASTGQIAVIGKSEGGGAVGQHVGVDIQDNVVMNVSAGGAKVHGLAVGGADPAVGLRIQSLRITTPPPSPEPGSTPPLIALVGQSMGSSGPGVQVLSSGSGLVLQGPAAPNGSPSPALPSSADLIIGASAGPAAAEALQLGTVAPQLNTTGRVNIRPMEMEINNPAQATPLNTQAIRIGAGNGSTNFNIDPRWLGLPVAAGGTASAAKYVLGSSSHVGLISVAPGALNNAGLISLQNQGAGSQGIQLGAQTGIRQLNLLTTGDITQSGPLSVSTLNIKMGADSEVQLATTGNQIQTLNFDGSEVAPSVTPAARTNSGETDIAGFNTSAAQFERLRINAVTGNNERPDPDRSFVGTDQMNELRTDVYLLGQLSRPQLCTPANTSTTSSVADNAADPLALEWVKVRKGPQLTNCAGMRTDSNCAAF